MTIDIGNRPTQYWLMGFNERENDWQGKYIIGLAVLIGALLALWVTPGARAAEADFAKRLTGYLKTGDGVALRYSALLPEKQGKFPVIVDYSGYASGSVGTPEVPNSRSLQGGMLDAGYAILGVNMRGTGCSEGGPFVTFDPHWARDGRRAVEWAAKQSWSNGKVGMAGQSFNGLSQLFTAAARPPSLRAIAPGMVVVDTYRDTAYPGGIKNFAFPNAWWYDIQRTWEQAGAAAEREGDARCIATVRRNLRQVENASTSPPDTLKDHRFIDPFMRRHSLVGETGKIDVPTLSMESYQDGAVGVRGGYYQKTLPPGKAWYVGTNGSHGMYYNARFLDQNLLPFLDRFVKGKRNGFAKRPRVELWQDSVGLGWSDSEPSRIVRIRRFPPRTKPVAFYLRSDHRLTRAKPSRREGASRYRYPVKGPNVNDGRFFMPGVTDDRFAGAWDELDPGWEEGSLAFTSPRLRKPLTVWGSASADLWVKTTTPDADLQVTVTAVRPDGQEQYLQRGWLRLSHRALKRRASTATRPVHRHTKRSKRRMPAQKAAFARLEIGKFMHTFRRDSRIRIWIDAPGITGRWGFAIRKQPGRIAVQHKRHRQSRIVFGRLRVKPPTYPLTACDSTFFEPCRADPLAALP